MERWVATLRAVQRAIDQVSQTRLAWYRRASERRPSEDDLREVRALDASLRRLYAEKRRLLARWTTDDDATVFLWWGVARPWVRPPDPTIPTTEGGMPVGDVGTPRAGDRPCAGR
jgi:hypothetical protein